MRRFPAAAFAGCEKELSVLRKLRTPGKIQDFLDSLPFNHERGGETYRSPAMAIRAGTAHCIEGAMIAGAALWFHGARPLLMDLKTAEPDVDHVVALFKKGDRWGAISKTNHSVLCYRDPVYRDPREVAMSYFNEYFLDDGRKTMRSFSRPFDLSRLGGGWLAAGRNLYDEVEALDFSPHVAVVNGAAAKGLRKASRAEIEAGKITAPES